MANNVIKGNVGILYILEDGSIKDQQNLDQFHPHSNVDILIVNIEGAGEDNTMAQINYSPTVPTKWTSHWFPLFRRGNIEHKISGENFVRTFTQYVGVVPSQILNLNKNREQPLSVKTTFKYIGGIVFKGAFDSLTSLNNEIPLNVPSVAQELQEQMAITYVFENNINTQGYYQVEHIGGNNYQWVRQEVIYAPIQSRGYNLGNIIIQGGFGNGSNITPLPQDQYNIIWQELSNIGGTIASLQDTINNILLELGDFYTRSETDLLLLNTLNEAKEYTDQKVGSGVGYEPDGETIVLNEENELSVSKNLEIDGGFL